ncbi:MAG: MerR family mercuric resistance operon transcriptional regulator [Candidatus Aldehydirespiratoraceae bacterium]|jgi:MerR family mercuric resistance operon transcriptional regulator
MNIGELSAICGVPAQTIRFYERRGLLAEPQRQSNGYRIYDDGAAERIAFIRRAQSAGLTLTEIGGVLDVRSDGRNPCSHVSQLLGTKLGEVKIQIGELRKLRQELEALIERSQQLNPADCTEGDICHILGAVASPAPLSSRPAKAISA